MIYSKIVYSISLLCLLALYFMACGNGRRIIPTGDVNISGKSYASLSGSCSKNAEGFLEGSCSIISLESLGGVSAEKSIQVEFELKDQGKITFRAFANIDQQGVDLQFQRNQNTLIVTGSIDGKTNVYTQKFSNIDASSTLAFQIDVHNSEQPTHVLIWNSNVAPNFSSSNALVNSIATISNPNNWGSARGSGSSLAISLENAVLKNLILSSPKYED